jgi:hypothetical protein
VSKILLSFLLSELKTIRIQCKNPRCKGAILEVPVDQLKSLYSSTSLSCPLCREDLFVGPNQQNWLNMLAVAIAGIQDASEKVEVEFILQAEDLPGYLTSRHS